MRKVLFKEIEDSIIVQMLVPSAMSGGLIFMLLKSE